MSGKKQPVVKYKPDGACSVSHMEYVQDIAAVGSGVVTTQFVVNPQRTATFPWLSAMATRFEVYKFRKLAFHYKPSTGTSTDGWVALGFDFDYYDEAPSKSTLLAWKYASKSAAWQNTTLDISNDARLSIAKYANYSATSGDARLDMLGNLWVLADSTSSGTLGELFVSYEVEFRQPAFKIPPALYASVKSKTTNNNKDTVFAGGATIVGNLLTSLVNSNTVSINDIGEFLVEYAQVGAGQTASPFMTFVQPSGSPSSSFEVLGNRDNIDTGNLTGIISKRIKVNVAPVNVAVGNSTGTAGAQYGELRIGTYAYATG
jgi:hypothetical protein